MNHECLLKPTWFTLLQVFCERDTAPLNLAFSPQESSDEDTMASVVDAQWQRRASMAVNTGVCLLSVGYKSLSFRVKTQTLYPGIHRHLITCGERRSARPMGDLLFVHVSSEGVPDARPTAHVGIVKHNKYKSK